jgi:L-aspartate oxidase
MSRHAGVIRDHDGLECLSQTLAAASPAGAGLDLATVEATNLHAVSVLVTVAALARAESRGCHRWRDEPPVIADQRARHAVMRVTDGRPLTVSTVRMKDEVGA